MDVSGIMSLALSTLQSLGIMPYISAALIIALVGGFISVMFSKK